MSMYVSGVRNMSSDAKMPTPSEQIHHPQHYGGDGPYEVIKVLEQWLTAEEFIGALKFNIIKYQARARHKGGPDDYAKAAWYSNYLVEFLKRTKS